MMGRSLANIALSQMIPTCVQAMAEEIIRAQYTANFVVMRTAKASIQ